MALANPMALIRQLEIWGTWGEPWPLGGCAERCEVRRRMDPIGQGSLKLGKPVERESDFMSTFREFKTSLPEVQHADRLEWLNCSARFGDRDAFRAHCTKFHFAPGQTSPAPTNGAAW
ncbi:hypothetical protein E4U15_003731 [Claviceps sp. LM218 group G6]|nr:hypothetical protein E4U15_003731 [Claviceps sp. LM218 group G6]